MDRTRANKDGDKMVSNDTWRLPGLRERGGTLAIALYATIAVIVSIIIAGSFWFNSRDYFSNMPIAAEYGFRTRTNDGGPEVASVTRREQGRSDLREGDRIQSIDGVKLPVNATEFTIAERLRKDRDGRAEIVTRSTDSTLRTHRIDRIPIDSSTMEPSARLPLWLYIAIGFGSAQLPLLVWFGASLFLAWRRPREPEAMLLAFAFLLLCINRGSGFWLNALAGVPWKAIILAENLGGCLMLLAMAGFPDGRFSNLFARWAVVMIGLLAMFATAVPVLDLTGPLIDGLPIPAIICVLASIWLRYRNTTEQAQRQQIKWAVFGFCSALALFLPVITLSAAGAVPDDGPAPVLLYLLVVPFGWLLIPIGLLISVMRYRLYDADAAISRSAAYATLTLVLAALFAASAEALEWLFQVSFGREAGALPNVMAAALAVLAINPLNSRIQRWAEWRFQRDLVRLRRDLPDCVEDMREVDSLDRLLATILDQVVAGVRADRGAVVIGRDVVAAVGTDLRLAQDWLENAELDSAADGLDANRGDDVFPMRVPLRVRHRAQDTFGWLLLGPRPDDSFYGRDEQETLADLAGPISRAVQIVLVREARDAEADRRRSEHEQRLSNVERKLAEAGELIAKLAEKGTPRKA